MSEQVIVESPAVQAPVSKATRREMFTRAADLLEEFGWCQWAPARDEDGWSVMPCDPYARSFCLTGAVERAVFDLFGVNVRTEGWKATGLLSNRPRTPGQKTKWDPVWNNDPERTKAEVVARLREAAEAS